MVPGARPVRVTLWLCFSAGSPALLPYEVVSPYSTRDEDGWSVVHVTIAVVVVMPDTDMAVIAGGNRLREPLTVMTWPAVMLPEKEKVL